MSSDKRKLPPALQALPLAHLFSAALDLGDFAITAGTLPLIENGEPKSELFRDQAEQAFRNMLDMLAACGQNKHNLAFVLIVVSCDIVKNYGPLNEVWEKAMEGVHPMPCRMAFQVAKLPCNALIEVAGLTR